MFTEHYATTISPNLIIVLEWCTVAIAFLSVLIRSCVRWKQRQFKPSDYAIVAALLSFTFCTACDTAIYIELSDYPNIHLFEIFSTLPPNQLRRVLIILYVSSPPYYLSLWLVKIALVLLYYDITPNTKYYRYPLHAISFAVGATLLAALILASFWCLPISRNWATDRKHACITYVKRDPYLINTSFHVITEICIFVYPLVLIRVLRHHKAKFRRASAMFGVGFLGVLISASRLIVLYGVSAMYPMISMTLVQADLEQAVGIVVCCLPAMRQAYLLVREKKRMQSDQSDMGRFEELGAQTEIGRREASPPGENVTEVFVRIHRVEIKNEV